MRRVEAGVEYYLRFQARRRWRRLHDMLAASAPLSSPPLGEGGSVCTVMRSASAPLSTPPCSGQADVLEIDRLAVDAAGRRRDPVGEAAALGDRLHQALEVRLVGLGRQPLGPLRIPLGLAENATVGRDLDLAEVADGAVEGPVGQPQFEVDLV